MKRTIILTAIVALLPIAWMGTQQPKLWWNDEWAGIALHRGGYRSWSMRFCDGHAMFDDDVGDGKWSPFIFDGTNDIKRGNFPFPKFSHTDIRPFLRLRNGNSVCISITNAPPK